MNENVHHLFVTTSHKHWMLTREMCGKEGIPCSPRILFEIAKHEGITQKELSMLLCIKPASVTATLDKLESLNCIYRKTDNKDLRIKRIYITENGYQMIKKAETVKEKTNQLAFKDFTEAEKNSFAQLLLKIEKNLEVANIE